MTPTQLLLIAGILLGTVVVLIVIAAITFPGFRRAVGRVLAEMLQGADATDQGTDAKGASAATYRPMPALLSPAERAFFPHVEAVLPSVAKHLGLAPLRAFAKVRLADLVEPDCPRGKGTPYMSWFGKISQKHVDVVLVDTATFRPVCVIELDDRSHQSARARDRDATKDAALASALIPVVRIAAAVRYDDRALARSIADALGGGGVGGVGGVGAG
ncbi:MAG: DUF2726 domain-containing protein [Planctomycetota bacterium]|nr:DUF2726 domain-containing protein [Planctomycetota bacterium]